MLKTHGSILHSRDRLVSWDLQSQPACVAAQEMTRKFPPKIPSSVKRWNKSETAQLDGIRDRIASFETYFVKTYPKLSLAWHGRLSFQRILWQDPHFLTLISGEDGQLVAKAILSSSEGKRLADTCTLRDLMLYGFSSNLPSYLCSAPPNWYQLPAFYEKEDLGTMGIRRTRQETSPKHESIEFQLFQKAHANVASVVAPQAFLREASVKDDGIEDLVEKIRTNVNESNIARICGGAAGASTAPELLNQQSEDVLRHFPKWLLQNKNSYVALMQEGLVSHALDARHLIAAIYFRSDSLEKLLKAVDLQSRSNEDAFSASVLIKIRLRQSLLVIHQVEGDGNATSEERKVFPIQRTQSRDRHPAVKKHRSEC